MTREDVLNRCLAAFGDAEILSICLGLRMQHCGSCDPWPDEQAAEVVECLKLRLEVWSPPSGPHWARFDDAVRELIRATLAEVGAA